MLTKEYTKVMRDYFNKKARLDFSYSCFQGLLGLGFGIAFKDHHFDELQYSFYLGALAIFTLASGLGILSGSLNERKANDLERKLQ